MATDFENSRYTISKNNQYSGGSSSPSKPSTPNIVTRDGQEGYWSGGTFIRTPTQVVSQGGEAGYMEGGSFHKISGWKGNVNDLRSAKSVQREQEKKAVGFASINSVGSDVGNVKQVGKNLYYKNSLIAQNVENYGKTAKGQLSVTVRNDNKNYTYEGDNLKYVRSKEGDLYNTTTQQAKFKGSDVFVGLTDENEQQFASAFDVTVQKTKFETAGDTTKTGADPLADEFLSNVEGSYGSKLYKVEKVGDKIKLTWEGGKNSQGIKAESERYLSDLIKSGKYANAEVGSDEQGNIYINSKKTLEGRVSELSLDNGVITVKTNKGKSAKLQELPSNQYSALLEEQGASVLGLQTQQAIGLIAQGQDAFKVYTANEKNKETEEAMNKNFEMTAKAIEMFNLPRKVYNQQLKERQEEYEYQKRSQEIYGNSIMNVPKSEGGFGEEVTSMSIEDWARAKAYSEPKGWIPSIADYEASGFIHVPNTADLDRDTEKSGLGWAVSKNALGMLGEFSKTVGLTTSAGWFYTAERLGVKKGNIISDVGYIPYKALTIMGETSTTFPVYIGSLLGGTGMAVVEGDWKTVENNAMPLAIYGTLTYGNQILGAVGKTASYNKYVAPAVSGFGKATEGSGLAFLGSRMVLPSAVGVMTYSQTGDWREAGAMVLAFSMQDYMARQKLTKAEEILVKLNAKSGGRAEVIPAGKEVEYRILADKYRSASQTETFNSWEFNAQKWGLNEPKVVNYANPSKISTNKLGGKYVNDIGEVNRVYNSNQYQSALQKWDTKASAEYVWGSSGNSQEWNALPSSLRDTTPIKITSSEKFYQKGFKEAFKDKPANEMVIRENNQVEFIKWKEYPDEGAYSGKQTVANDIGYWAGGKVKGAVEWTSNIVDFPVGVAKSPWRLWEDISTVLKADAQRQVWRQEDLRANTKAYIDKLPVVSNDYYSKVTGYDSATDKFTRIQTRVQDAKWETSTAKIKYQDFYGEAESVIPWESWHAPIKPIIRSNINPESYSNYVVPRSKSRTIYESNYDFAGKDVKPVTIASTPVREQAIMSYRYETPTITKAIIRYDAPVQTTQQKQMASLKLFQSPIIKFNTKQEIKSFSKLNTKQDIKIFQRAGLKLDTKIDTKLNTKQDIKLDQRQDMRQIQRYDQKMIQKEDIRMAQKLEQKQEIRLQQRVDTRLEQRIEQRTKIRIVPLVVQKQSGGLKMPALFSRKRETMSKGGLRDIGLSMYSSAKTQIATGNLRVTQPSAKYHKGLWSYDIMGSPTLEELKGLNSRKFIKRGVGFKNSNKKFGGWKL